MRFVSRRPELSIAVIKQKKEIVSTAQGPTQVMTGDSVIAQFRQGGLSPWEVDEGLRHFQGALNGLAEGVDPVHRLGSYDTETEQILKGWTDELRQMVEDRLVERIREQNGTEFIQVEKPKLRAPWPNYDKITVQGRRTIELVAEAIVEKVKEDGYDPHEVLAYERENLNRPMVVQAIENEIERRSREEHGIIAEIQA